jgi:hypothetical protein
MMLHTNHHGIHFYSTSEPLDVLARMIQSTFKTSPAPPISQEVSTITMLCLSASRRTTSRIKLVSTLNPGGLTKRIRASVSYRISWRFQVRAVGLGAFSPQAPSRFRIAEILCSETFTPVQLSTPMQHLSHWQQLLGCHLISEAFHKRVTLFFDPRKGTSPRIEHNLHKLCSDRQICTQTAAG